MPHLERLQWRRRDQPILSCMTTRQAWCRVQVHSPSVIKVNGTYRMWYVGNHTATRTPDMELGYARSDDGLHWTPYAQNPVLTARDLPFGTACGTPHVMFDAQLGLYRMWLLMSSGRRTEQGKLVDAAAKLGYATSADGIRWDVHPRPLLDGGRRPCVLKDGDAAYRMWMGAAPTGSTDRKATCKNIFRFVSTDGLDWRRDAEPAVMTREDRIIVYPFVLRHASGYTMWYGRTADKSVFEIYCSTSTDGLHWTNHHDDAALPATRDPGTFDSRYTSAPCVVDDGDRYLMYYSARDVGQLYGAADGTLRADKAGIYRHIGVAVSEKPGGSAEATERQSE